MIPPSDSHPCSSRNSLKRNRSLADKVLTNPSKKVKTEDCKGTKPIPPPAAQQDPITTALSLSPSAFWSRHIKQLDKQLSFSLLAPCPGTPTTFTITPIHVSQLSDTDLNNCFYLIKTTSGADYKASKEGWRPKKKMEEMKEPGMWYFLVREAALLDQNTTTGGPCKALEAEAKPSQPVGSHKRTAMSRGSLPDKFGFLSVLPTWEPLPSPHQPPSLCKPTLYIYELHLTSNLRGIGLGKHLLHLAWALAKGVGAERTMLTCYTRNRIAEGFYRRNGYEDDENSPPSRSTRNSVTRPDYVILYKCVDR